MIDRKIEERPLVTFALFAYNQEKYIREAIEGAFAQTYEPLEIILSDDCSTDRTFEIMQEMAKSYSGPHQVMTRRTRRNRGTFNHVLEVNGEMSGQLMILGAGDDISYANRCASIVDEWKRSGAKVLFSQYEKISDSGKSLGFEGSLGDQEIMEWFAKDNRQQFNLGATTAYDRCVFHNLEFSDAPIFNEDAVLYFLAMIKSFKIKEVSEPLVKYRQSINSISNDHQVKRDRIDIENFEKKIAWMADSYLALCDYALKLLAEESGNSKIRNRIYNTRRFSKIRSQWLNTSIWGRLVLFIKCRSWREMRFLVPRILGLRCFSYAKSMKLGAGN